MTKPINLREIESDLEDGFGCTGCTVTFDEAGTCTHEPDCLVERVRALVALVREARWIMFEVRGIDRPPAEDAWLARVQDEKD